MDTPSQLDPTDPVEPVEPVSLAIRRVGAIVRTEHHTVGVLRTLPGGVNQLDCACGVVLTNGPGWSLDEHLRMHRAEVKYAALLAVAHPAMPLTSRTDEAAAQVEALRAVLRGSTAAAVAVIEPMAPGARARLAHAALELAHLAQRGTHEE